MSRIFDQRLFLFVIETSQKVLAKLKLYEEVRSSTQFVKKQFGKRRLTVVEIGTQRGSNARSICNNLNVKKIYCIDPYGEYSENQQGKKYTHNFMSMLKIAMKKLKNYPVKFVPMESAKAAKYVPKNIDFVYIDGNHDYDFVIKDMILYYDLLKHGGVLAGHDFCGNFVEVIYAVFDFLKLHPKLELHTVNADWWFVKE